MQTGTSKLFDLSGRNAIVTGSGRGLGRAMARGLAEAGASVVIGDLDGESARDAAKELQTVGRRAIAVAFDARKRADVERLVATATETLGGLDIMVVNHGIATTAKAEDIAAEAWSETIDVNLTSAFTCAQEAGKQMIRQGRGGSIIFTGSINSLAVFPLFTSYGVTKAGIDQLARQLAVEWGPHKIRVNVIAPGWMSTYMRGREGAYESPELLKSIASLTPLGRKCNPEELVGPLVFFASDAASFVTGHVVPVDGGWCLR